MVTVAERPAITDDLTEDAFLGGRITLGQPRKGLRAGSDAMFLAASIPATPGEHVFEAGIGTGAVALALAARVGDLTVTGVERDPAHAALAGANAGRNGLADRVRVLDLDIADATSARLRGEGLATPFDHAFANPPYYDAERSRPPRSSSRRAAHIGASGDLGLWVARMADLVRGGGTVTLIHRAEALADLLAAMTGRVGGPTVMPLSPGADTPASRIIVQGVKGSRAAPRLLPPLVLHGSDGAYTAEVDAVLRHAAALDLRNSTAGRTVSSGAAG